jgi:hypothetical protein
MKTNINNYIQNLDLNFKQQHINICARVYEEEIHNFTKLEHEENEPASHTSTNEHTQNEITTQNNIIFLLSLL